MSYDPAELAALLSEPWSNGACRGYVIMVMKTAALPTRTSAVSWPSSMSCLILYLWMRPGPIIRKAPIDFETKCPEVERGKRAAPLWVPSSCVSPL